GVVRKSAATYAYRMHLRNIFGYCEKRGHGTERAPQVILIQTRRNHSQTSVRHLHAHADDSFVEELHFVNAHDLHSEHEMRAEFRRIIDDDSIKPPIVARDNSRQIKAIIDRWFENLRALASNFRAPNAANQLFALAAEHSAGDYFNPSAPGTESIHSIRSPSKTLSRFQAILVRHHFAAFDISLQEPEIHRPAVAGYAIVLVRLGPAGMMKLHLSRAVAFIKLKAQSRSLPIFIRAGQLQLELAARYGSRHLRVPLVSRSKPQLEVRALRRPT